MGTTKKCTKCGEEKELGEFHRNSRTSDGKTPHCKECRNGTSRNKYQVNKQDERLRAREYYYKNKHKKIKCITHRRQNDIATNMRERYKASTRRAVKGGGYSKHGASKEMLGCTWEELVLHLESQFSEGMSWDNRSDWHIDHIIPLASAQTEEELMALCHYTNLQPLWAVDNLSKGARLDWAA